MSTFGHCETATGMDSTQQHPTSGSPNSSEEIESHHGTPETKISSFSPEDLRNQPKTNAYGTVRANLPPAFSLGQSQDKSSPTAKLGNLALFGSQDPFISISGCASAGRGGNDPPKLSPVASTFTPFKYQEPITANTAPDVLTISVPRANAFPSISKHGNAALTPASTAGSATNESEKHSMLSNSEVPMTSSSQSTSSGTSSIPTSFEAELTKFGHFSSDGETSRSLVLSHIPRTTPTHDIDGFFNVSGFRLCSVPLADTLQSDNFGSLKHLSLKDLHLNGSIFVNFGDIRDAHKALIKIQSIHMNWAVEFIAGANYSSSSLYAGQVLVKADFTGPCHRFDPVTVGHMIKELLENYGEIMGFQAGVKTILNATYRAEFYDTGSADLALAYLNGFRIAVGVPNFRLCTSLLILPGLHSYHDPIQA